MATPPHVPSKDTKSQQNQPVTGPSGTKQDEKNQSHDPVDKANVHDREAREQHEARAREERETREKHEAEERQRRERGEHEHDDEETRRKEGLHQGDARKDDQEKKPKRQILAEGQAYQLFFNGHRIAKDGDHPSRWLSMSRLPDSTAVVQTPMTPDLEKKLKEGKYYLVEGLPEEPLEEPKSESSPL